MKKTPCVTPDEAVRVIQSGQTVFLSGNCSAPKLLTEALARRAPELSNVKVVQLLTLDQSLANPALTGHIRCIAPFIGPGVRTAINDGRADFLPSHLSQVPLLIADSDLPIDVALLQVSPPDKYGYCCLGTEGGVDIAAAVHAKTVIFEINDRVPRIPGECFVRIDRAARIIESSYQLIEIPLERQDEISSVIARNVVSLIEDGSTIQAGIGRIPDACMFALRERKNLRVHSEIITDSVMGLAEAGALGGKIVTGIVLGTQRMFDFVHENRLMLQLPTAYVNDPFVIARNNKMVAINGAIEVDLTGQINAESVPGQSFYSGVGGQCDFLRGAMRSRGGKAIIALPSTITPKGGELISRIVPHFKPGNGVTTSKYDVGYIVTEYGIARLKGKTIRERAEALIAIAHPMFREGLEKEAKALHYL